MEDLKLKADDAAATERLGEEFLAAIYGTAARRNPDNVSVLLELGHVYTRLGRYQDGLEVDHKLVEHAPDDPTVRYNLACSQALLGLHDAALGTLEVAMELGYGDIDFLEKDDDLASLRGDPRFEALLRRYRAD